MAFKLKKISAGVFKASPGVTVELSVSSDAPVEILRLVYDTQHVGAAPWKFKTVAGNNTLFVFMESTTPGAKINLNEVDGQNEQLLGFSFFDPVWPQDDIEIQG